MKNVNATISGNTLTITIDLTKEFGPSKSGKTIVIASTEGNKALTHPGTGEVMLGLNLYKYPNSK